MKPLYEHDCTNCIHLGVHDKADLYFCLQGGNMPTVIARYSNEGSDYTSGMLFPRPELIRAKELAKEKGLM